MEVSPPSLVRLGILSLAVLLLGLFGFRHDAQADAQADADPAVQINQIDSANFPAVEATVAVVDPSGMPIRGLGIQDVQVFDGARPAVVTDVSQAIDTGIGIAVVLAIDTSGSMAGEPLTVAKQVARDFVTRLSSEDQAMLLAFGASVSATQGFTADKNAMIRAIDGLEAGGNTALYDAVVASVGWAGGADLPRRAVVLLTDGQDRGERSSASRSSSLDSATRGGVPIFTAGLGPAPDHEYLNELASSTRGQAFSASTPAELGPLYDSILGLLGGQYIIKIDFGESARPGSHTLRVAVTADGSTGIDEMVFEAVLAGYSPPQISLPNLVVGQLIDVPLLIRPIFSGTKPIETVRYLWDGKVVSGITAPSYEHTIDPISFVPGAHSLRIEATDSLGVMEALEMPLQVAAVPPRIRIVGPQGNLEPGAIISLREPVVIEALVIAQSPVQTVRLHVNGSLQGERPSPPYVFDLDPEFFHGESDLELVVVALDTAGRTSEVSFGLQAPVAPGGESSFPFVMPLVALGALAIGAAASVWILHLHRLRRRRLLDPLHRLRRRRLLDPLPPTPTRTPPNESIPLTAEAAVGSRASGPLARLTVSPSDQPADPTILQLNREPLTVGSSPGCDLVLPGNDVAARQLRIWYRQGKFMLHAISPRISVSIAGKSVYWAVLEDGDEIEVGRYRLRFEQMGMDAAL